MVKHELLNKNVKVLAHIAKACACTITDGDTTFLTSKILGRLRILSATLPSSNWKTCIEQPPVHVPGEHSLGTEGRQVWIRCSGWLASGLHGGWIDGQTTSTLSPRAAWIHQSFGSMDPTAAAPGTPPKSNTALMHTCQKCMAYTTHARLSVCPTCVVTSQPSSKLTMTEEPVSSSSTTRTDTCRTLWSYGTQTQYKHKNNTLDLIIVR